jgi:hypothetical protein
MRTNVRKLQRHVGSACSKEGTQQIHLLSNNHVFGGCNHVPQNQPILSPPVATIAARIHVRPRRLAGTLKFMNCAVATLVS